MIETKEPNTYQCIPGYTHNNSKHLMKNVKFKAIINVRGFIEHYCLNHKKRDEAEQQYLWHLGFSRVHFCIWITNSAAIKSKWKVENIVMGFFFDWMFVSFSNLIFFNNFSSICYLPKNISENCVSFFSFTRWRSISWEALWLALDVFVCVSVCV